MRQSVARLTPFLIPVLCLAQAAPTIGVVEIFGARKTSPAEIRKVAGVSRGGRLPPSKVIVEEKLTGIEGVDGASLEAACCENGAIVLYIGIHEAGGPPLSFREFPTESPEMPEAISSAYSRFLEKVRAGSGSEDLTQGHSLLSDAGAREAQLAFIPMATDYAAQLRDILRRSSEGDHRAMAAYILGYGSDKKAAVEDLTYALHDPDATVRSNATRALAAVAVYASLNPSAGVTVQPSWFVELLNSPVWTDRNNAAVALVTLTESRNPDTLSYIRLHALPALTEMARWTHLPHALPAYILLGRTAGIPELELKSAWAKGARESIIARAIASKTK